MRVVKVGNLRHFCECPECKSILEYDDNDITIEREYDHVLKLEIWKSFIRCPLCKTKIKITEKAYEEF